MNFASRNQHEPCNQATTDDYRDHHILFAVDNQLQYVRELVSALT